MINFWIFFLKKRAFTYMIIGALVVAGTISMLAIPKESSPEVVIPIGIVSTVLRGGSAEDVEKLVTNKLEQEIANVENIDKLTSTSREGVSVISAQFLASADVDKSIQDLKDAIDRVKGSLPTDADEPNVSKVNFSDQPILIVSVSQDLAPSEFTKLGEDLEKEIKKVKGVSKVEVSGTRKNEVQVILSKEKVSSYGLSVEQVIGAIRSANAPLPIGRITISDIDYPVKFSGDISNANEIKDISLQAPSGALVYLRDVAFVTDGLQEPRNYSRISENGKPSENALTLFVYKKSGGDVGQIASAVNLKIEELKSGLLTGASVVVSIDNGKNVEKDLSELTRTGLETVILVMIVLFLTIGWRESIVAGLSIPLSFVIAFIGLYASGNTINFISLFSLILAIGILVDSGIVVAEAIHTRFKKGGDIYKAATDSIREYAWPLIAGTMTTVAVFFPLFFLTGVTGQFIKSIPFTIIFVLVASIFVALGMVPILATLLSKKEEKKSKFGEYQEKYFHIAQNWYKNSLRTILTNRKSQNRFFLALFLGFISSIILVASGLIKVELFPQDDQDFLIISIEKPSGSTLASTDLVVRQVEEILYEQKLVKSFVTTVGAGSSLVEGGGGANTKNANITIILSDDRRISSTEALNIISDDLKIINDAVVKVSQGNNGPPGGSPVQIKFKGDNLVDLSLAADKAEQILNEISGTKDVETSLRDDGTLVEIFIDRNKATSAGLTTASVAQVLRTSVSGVIATTIKKQSDDIDVLVKVALNDNYTNPEDTIIANTDNIMNLPINTQSGSILLGSILSTNISASRGAISHEDQKRVAQVSSNLKDGSTALEVVSEFKKREAELQLSSGVEIDYGGESEEINNTFRDMILALLSGLILMLAILVLEFNSFRFALYLLAAVPLSLIGVLYGLGITGNALSFSAMLGFIALAGVIINHAIILLDSILKRLENNTINNNLLDAIVESSAIRLRPIVLTTVTTVVGMIPLSFVSALWGPLAVSIMFGLSFAMLLTLILIPVLFYRYPGSKYKSLK